MGKHAELPAAPENPAKSNAPAAMADGSNLASDLRLGRQTGAEAFFFVFFRKRIEIMADHIARRESARLETRLATTSAGMGPTSSPQSNKRMPAIRSVQLCFLLLTNPEFDSPSERGLHSFTMAKVLSTTSRHGQ